MMALPPSLVGACQLTVTVPLPTITERFVGTPGRLWPVPGVTLLETAAAPAPSMLVARTVKL
jgi:hypothetical protein